MFPGWRGCDWDRRAELRKCDAGAGEDRLKKFENWATWWSSSACLEFMMSAWVMGADKWCRWGHKCCDDHPDKAENEGGPSTSRSCDSDLGGGISPASSILRSCWVSCGRCFPLFVVITFRRFVLMALVEADPWKTVASQRTGRCHLTIPVIPCSRHSAMKTRALKEQPKEWAKATIRNSVAQSSQVSYSCYWWEIYLLISRKSNWLPMRINSLETSRWR